MKANGNIQNYVYIDNDIFSLTLHGSKSVVLIRLSNGQTLQVFFGSCNKLFTHPMQTRINVSVLFSPYHGKKIAVIIFKATTGDWSDINHKTKNPFWMVHSLSHKWLICLVCFNLSQQLGGKQKLNSLLLLTNDFAVLWETLSQVHQNGTTDNDYLVIW